MNADAPRKGEYMLPRGARHAYCRSCGRDVAWIKTGNGRSMPLDLSTTVERDGQRYALSHFATCPQGREWSGHGRQVAAAPSAPASEPTGGTVFVAEYRERFRLGDGTLPVAWWLLGQRDFRAPAAPTEADIRSEAAALAAAHNAAVMDRREAHEE